MGGRLSVFGIDRPKVFMRLNDEVVFAINCDYANNYAQDAITAPEMYCIYDCRSWSAFQTESLHGAQWAWKLHSDIRDNDNDHDAAIVRDPNAAAPQFFDFLREATEGHVVLIFSDRNHVFHVRWFLSCLKQRVPLKPRILCVLSNGIEGFRQGFWQRELLTSVSPQVPIRSIAVFPRRLRSPTLLLGGVNDVHAAHRQLALLKITGVFNFGELSIPVPSWVTNDVYSSEKGTLELENIAKTIHQRLFRSKQKTGTRPAILLVDDYHGNHLAAAAACAFLAFCGLSVDRAIQYIFERKPSVDLNFLQWVRTMTFKRVLPTYRVLRLFRRDPSVKVEPENLRLISEPTKDNSPVHHDSTSADPAWVTQVPRKILFHKAAGPMQMNRGTPNGKGLGQERDPLRDGRKSFDGVRRFEDPRGNVFVYEELDE